MAEAKQSNASAANSRTSDVVTVNAVDASPERRAKMGADALERQRTHKPARLPSPYLVEVVKGGDILQARVEALDEHDAWARACDHWKFWPGGRAPGRKITPISAAS